MQVSLEVVGSYMLHLIEKRDVSGLLGGLLCQLPSHAHRTESAVNELPVMQWLTERLEMDDIAADHSENAICLQLGLDGIDRSQVDVESIGELICCGDYDCLTTKVASTIASWGALYVGSDINYSINEVNGKTYIALAFTELAAFGGSSTSCVALFKLKDGMAFNLFQ